MDEQEIAAAIGWMMVASGALAVMLAGVFSSHEFRATSAGLLLGLLGLLITGHIWAAGAVFVLTVARYGYYFYVRSSDDASSGWLLAARLVVAQAEGPVVGDELNEVRNLLSRLVRQQKPSGDYASTVVRDTGRPEVYLAFEDEADARKFAASLKAEASESYLGWASQRALELPVTKLAALEASLPPVKTRPRQDQADSLRLAPRVRRGSRTLNPRYDEKE